MSNTEEEEFVALHQPIVRYQTTVCTGKGTPENPHWIHRKLTGLALQACNCGFSSGWVPAESLPLSSDFLAAHMPPAGVVWGDQEYE